jgi:hypothetical protein
LFLLYRLVQSQVASLEAILIDQLQGASGSGIPHRPQVQGTFTFFPGVNF